MLELLLPTLILLAGGFHAAHRLRRLDSLNIIDVAIWMTCVFFGTGPWVGIVMGHGIWTAHTAGTVATAYFGIATFLLGLQCVSWLIYSRASQRAAALAEAPEHSIRLL